MHYKKSGTFLYVFLSVFLCFSSSAHAKQQEVVIYTALDQIFSEPILQEFEQRTNIKVKPVYDIEAVKTTGLVNRLIAEKSNPRCDVFWNNEIVRTIALKRKGILTPYQSPSAADIPASFKDKENYWTGFAARARVLVVNTNLVKPEDYPTSVEDLANAQWQGKAAMANPLFGTTSTHVAALFATQGPEQTTHFLKQILANGTHIVDGNSVVRDMTASGEVPFGITDTDDVNVGIISGMPITAVFPDQAGKGTLLIPNTVSLVANSPNPEAGRKLIDFLLSKEVEAKLAASESAQIPVRKAVKTPEGGLAQADIVAMEVDFEKMTDYLDESTKTVQQIFMK